MNSMRKTVCLLIAASMLVTASACKNEEPVVTTPTTASTVKTTKTTSTTAAPVQDNIITGLADMNNSNLSRPVGIMVANNDFIQSEQVGLGTADMWMEAETEGGITRMMAVYANSERVPAAIGPVRSARTPFAKVAESLGLGYVHAGGSYTALDYIASSSIADLDVNAGSEGGAYSWRDNEYPHDYEYTLRTNGEMLTQYLIDREYDLTPVTQFPWTFGTQNGETANKVGVTFSGAQSIGFVYDSAKGVYTKTNGSSETVHTDIGGTVIAPKNVIVLFSDKYYETDITIDFYMESGEGYIFSEGKMRRFDWTRDESGFTMKEKDGSQLALGKGKVYLCMVDADYESDLSYE